MSYQPTHQELVLRAEKWLKNKCNIVLADPYTQSVNHEWPDAIGWKVYKKRSLLIECKVTRADFLADKNKQHIVVPSVGMGDQRYYMCPPDLIHPSDLKPWFGLLWCYPKKVICKQKPNSGSHGPISGNKEAEAILLSCELNRWMKGFRTPHQPPGSSRQL